MFSSETKTSRNTMERNTQQSIIAGGTKITGDITSQGPLRIDGTLEGNVVTTDKVVIGKTGSIKGSLKGGDANVEGEFSGKLQLSGTLTLKATAKIEGEVYISKLSVEPGATFNATCSMGGSGIKMLSKENKSEKTA